MDGLSPFLLWLAWVALFVMAAWWVGSDSRETGGTSADDANAGADATAQPIGR